MGAEMWVAFEARHAAELQRLAAAISASGGRDEGILAVLGCARRLLDVDGCALYRRKDGASLSADGDTPTTLPAHGPGNGSDGESRVLTVALPGLDDELLGLWTREGRVYTEDEVHLAEVLAAFAALARTLGRQRGLVGGVLHELVTPLSCVTGFADALLGQWHRLGDDERRQLVVKIRRHATELSDLVGQLVDLAAVQAGRLGGDPATVDVAAECGALADLLRPVLGERTVSIDVPAVLVTVDPQLLRRTLTNLLSNAVKYSPEGSPLDIVGEVGDGEVHLAVTDRGAGMTSEEMGRAFDAFWRGSVPDGVRGAGIGLSLVREYVDAMGGRIDVRSTPGEGSTFTLTLPLP